MRQRALVLIKPQTSENFISVYMSEALSIIELEDWLVDLWTGYGIALYPSNSNRVTSYYGYSFQGPDEAA